MKDGIHCRGPLRESPLEVVGGGDRRQHTDRVRIVGSGGPCGIGFDHQGPVVIGDADVEHIARGSRDLRSDPSGKRFHDG